MDNGVVRFVLLWATLVYDPIAHWVWGGGWIGDMIFIGLEEGALDFAGGAVVHISSGVDALAVGIFATAALGGTEGLWHGNAAQFLNQIVSVAATWVYAFVVTFVILKVLDMIMGIRVAEDDEIIGLDVSQHGELAYRQ